MNYNDISPENVNYYFLLIEEFKNVSKELFDNYKRKGTFIYSVLKNGKYTIYGWNGGEIDYSIIIGNL